MLSGICNSASNTIEPIKAFLKQAHCVIREICNFNQIL
ncbi:MAG: hypothetical protein FD170_1297 [Bacteroidetes bacterium]|nr:MAG: hypothetical protein FD170_1297 [Bacteroidota bacterium]